MLHGFHFMGIELRNKIANNSFKVLVVFSFLDMGGLNNGGVSELDFGVHFYDPISSKYSSG